MLTKRVYFADLGPELGFSMAYWYPQMCFYYVLDTFRASINLQTSPKLDYDIEYVSGKKNFAWKTAQGDPNFAALFFRQFSPKQQFFENFEIVFCAYGGANTFFGVWVFQ